jgi:RimJ/RimL family protein N-acetyltransferase
MVLTRARPERDAAVTARSDAAVAPAPRPPPDVIGRIVPPVFRPVIVTSRLLLRPLRSTDVDDMVAGVADFEVSKMLASVPHPYAADDARAAEARARANAVAQRGVNLAITLSGRLIGQIGLNGIHARNGVGYWLARPYWGKGYATEAVGAVVAYAFDELHLPFVRAGVFADNPASLHVLAKLGFRRVGVRNSRSLARNQHLQHIATVLTRARYYGETRR